MGFTMREDNSMINPQMWLLKKELVKKKNKSKGMLLILIVFLISLLVISRFTNNGSQMSSAERFNKGFITGSYLSPFSYIWLSESYYG
jgi:hypothetical protein